MAMDDAPPIVIRRVEKPIGIYIMALCDFIILGLLPFALLLLRIRREDATQFVLVFASVLLFFAVMGGAVWAASGDNFGRKFLLGAVSTIAALWILGAATFLTSGEFEGVRKTGAIGYIVRAVTALGLNWWYFNRKNVVEYYRVQETRRKAS